MPSTRILIVEDESIIALDIKRSLLGLGYDVIAIVDTGESALAIAAETLPDLVLMDIRLRGEMDGITAAGRLRDSLKLPVVFLTAHADAATLKQAKETMPFGYIVKPFETYNLTTAVEVALSRHQAEQATQRMLQTERELNELKSQFVFIVSHEFRNPLSSIQFCLNLLDRPGVDEGKRQVYLQRAQASVERMKELLEDVLVLGEIESSGLPCHPRPMNLLQFCRELVEELQSTLQTSHYLVLVSEKSDRQGTAIYSLDIKLLRHILVNLLSNAIKYSPQGGTVKLVVECQSDRVTLRVQDSGIGIPEPDRLKLFAPFYRAANTSTIPGTGLGLCIVKKCVEAHGGKITVESQVGIGTTFTVTLSPQFLGLVA